MHEQLYRYFVDVSCLKTCVGSEIEEAKCIKLFRDYLRSVMMLTRSWRARRPEPTAPLMPGFLVNAFQGRVQS